MSQQNRRRSLWVATALAAALGLAACDKTDTTPTPTANPTTPGEKLDNAIANTQQAAEQARENVANSTAEARADVSNAASNAADAVKEAGHEAKEGLAAAGAAIGGALDDAGITASVKTDLAKDPDLSALSINVDTKNGAVTLTGPAPSATAKSRAEEIAKAVKGVSSVTNNLEVK